MGPCPGTCAGPPNRQGFSACAPYRARGPLRAFADILLDMHAPPGDRLSRRRRFEGVGRYPGTLQHLTAELNPEGTDYLPLPADPPEAALPPALQTLRRLLAEAPGR